MTVENTFNADQKNQIIRLLLFNTLMLKLQGIKFQTLKYVINHKH